ncbi:MAG: 30S ribosomal protein S16 [Gammaproteobacteria bacterium]|nr:30S ribosomal protein S16 [Gammaproteobacteria bacterium]MBT4462656.1 30S ribosomal protein S16 [Gammaproteobacteria bacterium]MBT4654903.1 30S ribosomal protein S16 [Gammaproteobacteria bacterium]MBT5761776.1 30S ribosomal protein S16 [Gammaproteobacteria bacterium]MBT7932048.1 30S ribosomal protein S16 [Gammaproteobacteria bacterium]
MVRIRLSRGGAKKRPYYHIVVMDQRDRRDGRSLERIGSYDPALETQDRIKIDMERLDYWVSKGAQISERVKYLKKYSLDPENIKTREKVKSLQLEKVKQKRLSKKQAEATPAEAAEAEAAPAEAPKAEAAPAEAASAEAAPAEAPEAEAAPAEAAPAEAPEAEAAPADDKEK